VKDRVKHYGRLTQYELLALVLERWKSTWFYSGVRNYSRVFVQPKVRLVVLNKFQWTVGFEPKIPRSLKPLLNQLRRHHSSTLFLGLKNGIIILEMGDVFNRSWKTIESIILTFTIGTAIESFFFKLIGDVIEPINKLLKNNSIIANTRVGLVLVPSVRSWRDFLNFGVLCQNRGNGTVKSDSKN